MFSYILILIYFFFIDDHACLYKGLIFGSQKSSLKTTLYKSFNWIRQIVCKSSYNSHQSSSRMASLLQRGLHPLVSPDKSGLRMFWNAFATPGTQPADVAYAITGVKKRVLVLGT